MQRLFSSFIGTFRYRYYSSGTAFYQKRWKPSKFVNKDKSGKTGIKIRRKPGIKWTDEQSRVLSAILDGKSVFISGSAGSGKTTLVEHAIKGLKKKHSRSEVFVTASTGVAACALNGLTLHSFAGAGHANVADRESLLNRVSSDRRACMRWNKAKVLVIDEISMIDGEFFDNLEYLARIVRDRDLSCKTKPWGGLQLVVSGDFFQLPPVLNRKGGKEYAFEADCWDASFSLQVELPQVFRQTEAELVKLLQGIRKGDYDDEGLKLLEQRSCPPEEDPSAVQLFPRIADVDRVNKKYLHELGEQITVYTALDTGKESAKKQFRSGIVPDQLELCLGARVMLCKNICPWKKLVNGATGTIIDFHSINDAKLSLQSGENGKNYDVTGIFDSDLDSICGDGRVLPVVKFDSGQVYRIGLETWVVMEGESVVAKRRQIPLILAWAMSIHKCQGMTIDRLHTDLRRAFGSGMVYVALSRVKTLDGLHLLGFSDKKIRADPKVLEFYKKISPTQFEQKPDIGSAGAAAAATMDDDGSRTGTSTSTDDLVRFINLAQGHLKAR